MPVYGTSFNTHSAGMNQPGAGVTMANHEDWEKAVKFFKYLGDKRGQAIKRDIAKAHRDFSVRLKKTILQGLATSGASINAFWPPHSTNYKGNELLRLNYHYQAALSMMQPVQKNYNVSLRISTSAARSVSVKDGLTMGQYALINEFGSVKRGIPARALWVPSFKKLGGDKAVLARTKGAVQNRLNKMGIKLGTSPRNFEPEDGSK